MSSLTWCEQDHIPSCDPDHVTQRTQDFVILITGDPNHVTGITLAFVTPVTCDIPHISELDVIFLTCDLNHKISSKVAWVG